MNHQHHEHEPDRSGGRRARSRWWAAGLAGVTGLALTAVGVTAGPAVDAVAHTLTSTGSERPNGSSAEDDRGKHDDGKRDDKGKDDKGRGKKGKKPKGVPVPCKADALIAAITLANARGGAILDLAPKCTYLLTDDIDGAGLPAITTPITLNGGKHTTIKRAAAAEQFRILTVEVGGDLTLNHLKITGGHTTDSGGGILVNAGGALTTNHSTVTRNIASGNGGGISNFGITRINHSTVDHNTAGSSGGGIVSTAVLEISKSHISANTADLGGGVSSAEGTVRVEHSAIAANHAQSLAGGLLMESGVGIVVDSRITDNVTTGSGGIFVESGQFTLRRVTLAGNTSSENDGGGLRSNPEASVVIEDSLVKNNTAAAANADGGGIYSAGRLVVRHTKIIGNRAGDQGGGINNESTSVATLFATKVVRNIAVVEGGGIFNEGGTVELNPATGTVVVKNRPDNCAGDVPGCAG
ncbi:right-handed parallel beta-helix repeat-containing protein [Salinispora arenicola]|uniref:Polymorphic outer membrane protein n=3 Tax=Salinispora arenicola TaxID=168697 RepID=A0A542XP32_SALAC|nr:right-handed parallel beta-helix repeat-containing protein [Salinispora arenicola]TQL37617.1 hypothetical protein FB564_2783 [Salinispora arenicola]